MGVWEERRVALERASFLCESVRSGSWTKGRKELALETIKRAEDALSALRKEVEALSAAQ